MLKKSDRQNIEADVCLITSQQPDELFWLKMDYGCDFLRHWIGDDRAIDRKLMEQLPEFWAWWTQVWTNQDKRFVSRFKGRKACVKTYQAIHNPVGLAMYPNRAILEGYHRLIKRLANQILTEQ